MASPIPESIPGGTASYRYYIPLDLMSQDSSNPAPLQRIGLRSHFVL